MKSSKRAYHFTAGLGPPFLFVSYQSHSPGLVLISLYTFPVLGCVFSKDFVLDSTLVRPCTAYYVIPVRRFGSLPASVFFADIRLPSDSTSRWTPLPSANASYCRARSGLAPPSCCPCRSLFSLRKVYPRVLHKTTMRIRKGREHMTNAKQTNCAEYARGPPK